MSNTMKLCLRTGIIVILMIIINWAMGAIKQGMFSGMPGYVPLIVTYFPYLLMGITVGTMGNPRFANKKRNWIYLIPTILFLLIAATPFLYLILPPFISANSFTAYFSNFAALSWVFTGIFASQSF
ncbi:MAG: hypothetical protein RRY25_02510, partial [Anaerovorax sp.]